MKITHQSKQTGFTLLEVLIALVILSVGLLGLAGIQQTGVRNNHNALLRSQASFLAYEVVDYMRSNLVGVQLLHYDAVAAPTAPVCGEASACDNTAANRMADYDLVNWYNNLTAALPNGNGTIACTDSDTTDAIVCTPGSTISVTVTWDESTISGTTTQAFNTDIQL